MDPKPRPNREIYLEILRRMTPEQKLAKVFELNAMTRELFSVGLRKKYPDLSDEEFHKVLVEHLSACHNSNY